MILFEGSHYRVRFNRVSSDDFVVIGFDPADPQQDFCKPFWGEEFFRRRGINAIGVQAAANDWYTHTQIEAALAAIGAATVGMQRVGYGASMGGYGALNHAEALDLRRVAAVAPQFSPDPQQAPFDRRFDYLKSTEGFPLDRMSTQRRRACGYVVFDPLLHEDRRHVELIAEHHDLAGVLVPLSGHGPLQVLIEAGILEDMLIGMLRGTSPVGALRTALRRERCQSKTYMAEMGFQMLRRHDAPGASAMFERARALAQQPDFGLDAVAAETFLVRRQYDHADRLMVAWTDHHQHADAAHALRERIRIARGQNFPAEPPSELDGADHRTYGHDSFTDFVLPQKAIPNMDGTEALPVLRQDRSPHANGAASPGGELLGSLDGVEAGVIRGWAFDPAAPDDPVTLRVVVDGTTIGEVVAELFRKDLAEAGIGAGSHGFELKLRRGLSSRRRHVIQVQRLRDGRDVANSPMVFDRPAEKLPSVAESAAPASAAPVNPIRPGHLDMATHDWISGWAWDSAQPGSPVELQIFDNGVLLMQVIADELRTDLADAGLGKGRHGFKAAFPTALAVSERHVIDVRRTDGVALEGSPIVLQAHGVGPAPAEPVALLPAAGLCTHLRALPDNDAPPLAASGWRAIRRLLFVAGEPDTPGATYRCERNAAACRAAGYAAECIRIDGWTREKLASADVLVLWRAAFSQEVQTMVAQARAFGTRVVFDIDDLMVKPELARIGIIDGIRTIEVSEQKIGELFQLMQRSLKLADLCFATTDELAGHMREHCDAVHVLPNTFDEDTHAASRLALRARVQRAPETKIRIGYAGGTRTHQKDFAVVAPALARVLDQRPDVILVLFREAANQRGVLLVEEFPELAPFLDRIEWRELVPLAALPAELARFDISLAPLEQHNPFCNSKSELKFFESALAGAVVVASPTGPLRRAIDDGITGFLAGFDSAWESILLRLIDDAPLRRRVARAAYHDVLWRFGPRRQADLFATLLTTLDGGPAGARAHALALRRGSFVAERLPDIPDAALLFGQDQLAEAAVTVVMTSYNYQAHVVEALESVRAQTLEILDLALVDDGSTDQSLPVILEWVQAHRARFNRIQILRTRRNEGLGGARNVVFSAAETPYLLPLDSDNRLEPTACATLLAALRNNPAAAFAYGRIQQFGGADGVMGGAEFDPARLVGGNYIDAMAMVAKWAWALAGGYYVRRDAMGWEDYDLWCQLVEHGQYGVAVPQTVAAYRVHPTSMVNSITEQSENKRRMVQFVEQRHPWLRLRVREAKQRE